MIVCLDKFQEVKEQSAPFMKYATSSPFKSEEIEPTYCNKKLISPKQK